MRFVFDERAAAQAAAWLLRRHAGPMPSIALIKLLYLADRRSFVETGYPITGDRLVATPHGPMLGNILDLTAWGSRGECSAWSELVTAPSDYRVAATGPATGDDLADYGALSDYDRDLLDAIHDEYGTMDCQALTDVTRALPEWRDPGESSVPIDPRDILRATGYADDQIAQVEDNIGASHSLERTLTGSR